MCRDTWLLVYQVVDTLLWSILIWYGRAPSLMRFCSRYLQYTVLRVVVMPAGIVLRTL
jgi:hypothetical protein